MKKNHHLAHRHNGHLTKHTKTLKVIAKPLRDHAVVDARATLSTLIKKTKQGLDQFEDAAAETAEQADEFIRHKPYQAVGVALGIGAFIGFCFARRR